MLRYQIIKSTNEGGDESWEVSDGVVGERSHSYDFNTEEEADEYLLDLNRYHKKEYELFKGIK